MAKNPLIRSYPKKVNAPLQKKSAGILDDFAVRKNVATKEGTVEKVPTNDSDIANKKYVDDLTGDHPHQDVQTTASPTFVKVSAPAGEFDTIATDTDGDITFLNDCYFTNRTGHDTFLDCVADEHIDWTDTTEDFKTTGSGSFGEGLEVNKNTTNQVGLTLNGIDVGGPFGPRGGFVKWFLNDRFVGGYTFMNDRQEIVFDTTIQATSADQGNAFINVMNGSAGFAGGDLTISSTGELETSSNINIASDTNGLQLGAGQDVKLYSNGSSGNFIFESDDKVQVRLGTTTTPFTTTFLQLEDGESHMGFNPGANLVDGIRVFEDSASGENRDFRIYGYPTGESNIYGQFKITSGSEFSISSSGGDIGLLNNAIVYGDLNVTGNITADTYFGDGSQLTDIVGDGFYNWTEGAGATDNFKTANNATIEGIIFGETKALSYEYEKIINGEFTSNSDGWIEGTGWGHDSGLKAERYYHMGNIAGVQLIQHVPLIAGDTYEVKYSILDWDVTPFTERLEILFGGDIGTGTSVAVHNSNVDGGEVGDYSYTVVAPTNSSLYFIIDQDGPITIFNMSLDDISVRKIIPAGEYNEFNGSIILGEGGDIYYRSSVYDEEKYGNPFKYFKDVSEYSKLDDKTNNLVMEHSNRPPFLQKNFTRGYGGEVVFMEGLQSWSSWIEYSNYKVIQKVNDLEIENQMLKDCIINSDDFIKLKECIK